MATILGTNGHDNSALGGQSLIGTNTADEIYGLAGNDRLEGRNGNDYLNGGSGYDLIFGGNGNDYVVDSDVGYLDGGAGNDTVDFGTTNSGGQFDLGAGAASLGLSGPAFTMRSFENINGTGGDDYIRGSSASNRIASGFGNDEVEAGGGNDTINGGYGNDFIDGGAGNDLINGGPGYNTLSGGSGNDTFIGGQGGDYVDGGAGFDTLSYTSSATGIVVEVELEGRDLAGVVSRNLSPDGDSFATVEKIIGSSYGDEMFAAGTIELDGFAGNDEIYSGAGANKLTGGAGNDLLSYYYSNVGVTVNLGTRKASGGWAQGDKIAGFEDLVGSNFADNLTGSRGANDLYGALGNDKLNGGAGADSLYGGDGNDQIQGSAGADYLYGGLGADTLWGGSGADRFFFYEQQDSPAGETDVIRDFSRSQGDKIDVDGVHGPTLAFIGKAAFSAAGQVRFQQSGGNTIVEVNTTGNSVPEMAIQLTGTINLLASDFLL